MIILSGVFVLVAIVLLIAGIVAGNSGAEVAGLSGMDLIYVSIGISIVSALCLLIGVILRRKELFGAAPTRPAGPATQPAKHGRRGAKAAKTGAATGETARSGVTAAERAGDDTAGTGEGDDVPAPPPVDVPADAVVYVVPGRRRYHIDSCRQLAGRGKEELTFEEAREEGFSPCTACIPDTALAARAAASSGGGLAPDLARATTAADTAGTKIGGTEVREDQPEDAGVEPSASDATVTGPATEPINVVGGQSPVGHETEEASEGGDSDAGDESGMPDDEHGAEDNVSPEQGERDTSLPPSVAEVPPQAPPEQEPPEQAEGSAKVANGPQVRILSGTKRYHRPDCALIEDIGDESDDLESLSRAEAKARGCTPCLVCQPDKEPAARD